MAMGISVCMIVRNGGKTIERSLSSVHGFDPDIIVVDTGSADNTIEIAEKHGAEIVSIKWRDDFAYARNVSIRLARQSWIMWLDADDEVSPESIDALKKIRVQVPDHCYSFECENTNLCAPWDDSASTQKIFAQARMFPNFRGIRFEGKIHESFGNSATAAQIGIVHRPDIKIYHHGYQDAAVYREKFRRNMRLSLASKYYPSGHDFLEFDSVDKKYMCFYSQMDAQLYLCKGKTNIARINYNDAFQDRSFSMEGIFGSVNSAVQWLETNDYPSQYLVEFKVGKSGDINDILPAMDAVNKISEQIGKQIVNS